MLRARAVIRSVSEEAMEIIAEAMDENNDVWAYLNDVRWVYAICSP